MVRVVIGILLASTTLFGATSFLQKDKLEKQNLAINDLSSHQITPDIAISSLSWIGKEETNDVSRNLIDQTNLLRSVLCISDRKFCPSDLNALSNDELIKGAAKSGILSFQFSEDCKTSDNETSCSLSALLFLKTFEQTTILCDRGKQEFCNYKLENYKLK